MVILSIKLTFPWFFPLFQRYVHKKKHITINVNTQIINKHQCPTHVWCQLQDNWSPCQVAQVCAWRKDYQWKCSITITTTTTSKIAIIGSSRLLKFAEFNVVYLDKRRNFSVTPRTLLLFSPSLRPVPFSFFFHLGWPSRVQALEPRQ